MNLRKGRYFVLLAMILSVGTLIISLQWESEVAGVNPIGRQLFTSMLTGQLLVVIFLLPGLVANTIILERDRHILPMLLITPLGSGRILLGKLLATFGILGLLIVSIYPLMAICMARGGVSPWELIGGCILLLYLGGMVSCFALFHALRATTTFRAVIMTQFSLFFCYLVLLPGLTLFVFFGSSLLIGIVRVLSNPNNVQTVTTIMIVIGSVFAAMYLIVVPLFVLWQTRKRLQDIDPRARSQSEMVRAIEFQFSQINQPLEEKHRSHWEHHSSKKNPFFVRELMGAEAARNPYAMPAWYLIAVFAHLFLWGAFLGGAEWLFAIALVFMAQLIPPYSAGLFAGEREQETWDMVRITQNRPWKMLWGKLHYALRQCGLRALGLYLAPVLVGSLVFTLVSGHSERWGVYAVLMDTPLFVVHLTFLVLLCAYFSSRHKQLYSVYGWSYGLIGLYLFGPLFFWTLTESIPGPSQLWINFWLSAINPILFTIERTNEELFIGDIWLAQMILYASLSLVMLGLTMWELRKEG